MTNDLDVLRTFRHYLDRYLKYAEAFPANDQTMTISFQVLAEAEEQQRVAEVKAVVSRKELPGLSQ